ncbi:hypothetical protein VM1G_04970 [Cytospora mali]|uniref:Uncharacterized protein n=1 Tax=Cytospora mali TaxID=578113 RepID=A0A194VZY6_CYTMA|nr:hypothetical protein VM1G_04970 [Valsa mali]
MAGLVNASWEVPPITSLDISDCNGIGPWAAYYYTAVGEWLGEGSFSWDEMSTIEDIPINVVLDFLRSTVPRNWTQPTDGELLLWYLDFYEYVQLDNYQTLRAMINVSLFQCQYSVCPNLNFSGDSDLSGIGMMISYYMIAIFATLYYFALVPGFFEAYGHSFKSLKIVSRYRKIAAGFEESVAGFLDAMLLFSVSMLLAAITRYVSVSESPYDTHSVFGLQTSIFLSTFSIFPALILQSLSHDLRRQRIRLAMWDLVIIFSITVEVLYRVEYRGWIRTGHFSEDSDGGAQMTQAYWFELCQSLDLVQSLLTLLSVGHAVLVLNFTAWLYIVAEIYFGKWWLPAMQRRTIWWKRWETCRIWLRVGNGLLCIAIMWAFLKVFTDYRQDVMENAGESDKDGDWTFGQVLSLTTWIPIGVELLSVYIYGAPKTIERGISTRYKVVGRDDIGAPQQVVSEKRSKKRSEMRPDTMEMALLHAHEDS